jgi:hypothetical protein
MNSEQDLINKLLISKKIMDKHNDMGRGQARELPNLPEVQEFQAPSATYNLPQEFIQESTPKQYNTETPTKDRILNSRLPDEIKQLMIEHPIDQPTMGVNSGVGLSSDLVERASRLMNNNVSEEKVSTTKQKSVPQQSNNDIGQIVRETVESVLRENGLLTESETKSNDQFKFRVGQHIFEGRVTKIKKIAK